MYIFAYLELHLFVPGAGNLLPIKPEIVFFIPREEQDFFRAPSGDLEIQDLIPNFIPSILGMAGKRLCCGKGTELAGNLQEKQNYRVDLSLKMKIFNPEKFLIPEIFKSLLLFLAFFFWLGLDHKFGEFKLELLMYLLIDRFVLCIL